jgi:ATP-binding cassette, subfamily B, bacterial
MRRTILASLRRVPFVPQLEVSECGSACLRMILRFHGCDVPLRELRKQCDIGRDGVSAKAVAQTARKYGLAVRGLKCHAQGLNGIATPAILHWDFNHFVVLERASRTRFSLVDPAVGRRTATYEEMERSFTGVALEIRPGGGFQRRRERSRYRGELRRHARPYLEVALLILGALLVQEVLGVGVPILEQLLIDHVLIDGRANWYWGVMAGLGSITILAPVVGYLQARTLARLRAAVMLRHVGRFVTTLARLPASFLLQRSTGDLGQRVRSQEQLQELGMKLVSYALQAVMLLSGVALLVAYEPMLGTLAGSIAAARACAVALAEWRLRHASASELVFAAKERAACTDALMSQELLRGLHATNHARQRYGRYLAQRLNMSLRLGRNARNITALLAVSDGVAQSALLFLCAKAVLRGEMSTGSLAAFVAVGRLLHRPMASVAAFLTDLTRATTIEPSVRDVLEQETEAWGTSERRLSGSVELRDVGFRYAGQEGQALKRVSLRIAAGEVIGVCGRSGSGKSTLGKLLARLVEPAAGRISFDGISPSTLTESDFRRQVALVPQDVFLCEGSVRLNVGLGAHAAPAAAMEKALWLAYADTFVAELPNGLDSEVGPNGSNLSGGERQRLALARALVVTPKIIVLDEATSCLDSRTEAELCRRLSELGCTQILISHRYRTLAKAGRILVVEEGAIVQDGTPTELLAIAGPFRDLYADELRRQATI